jgi:hypothetical protein
LEGWPLSPFLNTGATIAVFQSDGILLWLMDAWNINVSAGVIYILSSPFSSVFTSEDLSNMPDMGVSSTPEIPPIIIHHNGVMKLLTSLKFLLGEFLHCIV